MILYDVYNMNIIGSIYIDNIINNIIIQHDMADMVSLMHLDRSVTSIEKCQND